MSWLDNATEVWVIVQRGTDMTLSDAETGKLIGFETEFDAAMRISGMDKPGDYETRALQLES